MKLIGHFLFFALLAAAGLITCIVVYGDIQVIDFLRTAVYWVSNLVDAVIRAFSIVRDFIAGV
jgi:hypothetical protein